jgi:hypothetical protein
MLHHTLSVLFPSQWVSILRFDGSSHCTNSLHNISIDGLIYLINIGDQLLNVIWIFLNLDQYGDTDLYWYIVCGQYRVVWTFVDEILLWYNIFNFCKWGTTHHARFSIVGESTTIHNYRNGAIGAVLKYYKSKDITYMIMYGEHPLSGSHTKIVAPS